MGDCREYADGIRSSNNVDNAEVNADNAEGYPFFTHSCDQHQHGCEIVAITKTSSIQRLEIEPARITDSMIGVIEENVSVLGTGAALHKGRTYLHLN